MEQTFKQYWKIHKARFKVMATREWIKARSSTFSIGDRVKDNELGIVGTISDIDVDDFYGVDVTFDDTTECYTIDGRRWADKDIVLIKLPPDADGETIDNDTTF